MSSVPAWMVPLAGKLEPLERLPLWARVLVCERVVRRAAMAVLEQGPAAEHDGARVALAGCDLAARCAHKGAVLDAWKGEVKGLMDMGRDDRSPAVLMAMRWLLDAALGAQLESDFGGAGGSTSRAVWSAIAALSRDARMPQLQVLILMGGDVDLVGFACTEARVVLDGAMGREVLERLAPVHALTLVEVRPTEEELAR